MNAPRRTWTRSDKRELADQIAKLRAEGKSLKEIGEAIGKHPSLVSRIIQLFDLPRYRNTLPVSSVHPAPTPPEFAEEGAP